MIATFPSIDTHRIVGHRQESASDTDVRLVRRCVLSERVTTGLDPACGGQVDSVSAGSGQRPRSGPATGRVLAGGAQS